MRKGIVASALAVALALGLAGCGVRFESSRLDGVRRLELREPDRTQPKLAPAVRLVEDGARIRELGRYLEGLGRRFKPLATFRGTPEMTLLATGVKPFYLSLEGTDLTVDFGKAKGLGLQACEISLAEREDLYRVLGVPIPPVPEGYPKK